MSSTLHLLRIMMSIRRCRSRWTMKSRSARMRNDVTVLATSRRPRLAGSSSTPGGKMSHYCHQTFHVISYLQDLSYNASSTDRRKIIYTWYNNWIFTRIICRIIISPGTHDTPIYRQAGWETWNVFYDLKYLTANTHATHLHLFFKA